MSFIRVLRTIFTADPSGFIKGADAVERKLADQARAVEASKSSLLSAFSPAGLAGMAAGVVGIGTALEGLKGGFKSAINAEQFEKATEIMLGSAEKAKTLSAEIGKIQVKTPFKTSDLRAGARGLVAVGMEGDRVVKTLKMITDVAAGTGSSVEEIAQIFTKSIGRDKIDSRLLTKLAPFGIVKALGQELGVTSEKVMELAEKGKLGFSDIEAAFGRLTGIGGRFHGVAEAMVHTTGGAFVKLEEWGEKLWKGIAEDLLNAFDVSGGIDQLVAKFNEIKPAVLGVAKTFAQGFSTIFGNIADLITSVLGAADKVNLALSTAIEQAAKLAGIKPQSEGGPGVTAIAKAGLDQFTDVSAGLLKFVAAGAAVVPEMGINAAMGKGLISPVADAIIADAKQMAFGTTIEQSIANAVEDSGKKAKPKPEPEKPPLSFKELGKQFAGLGTDALFKTDAFAGLKQVASDLANVARPSTFEQLISEAAAQGNRFLEQNAAKPIEKVELPPAALEGSVEAYKIAIRQQQQSTQSPDKKIEQNTKNTASGVDQLVELIRGGVALGFANL